MEDRSLGGGKKGGGYGSLGSREGRDGGWSSYWRGSRCSSGGDSSDAHSRAVAIVGLSAGGIAAGSIAALMMASHVSMVFARSLCDLLESVGAARLATVVRGYHGNRGCRPRWPGHPLPCRLIILLSLTNNEQGVAAQPIPILPPPSLPDPPASPVITPSTSHPVPPIQPPDISPDHALSDSDSDLDVADAYPEVDSAPPRREKRIPGWLYSTVASSGVTELPVPPPARLPRRSARLQKRGQKGQHWADSMQRGQIQEWLGKEEKVKQVQVSAKSQPGGFEIPCRITSCSLSSVQDPYSISRRSLAEVAINDLVSANPFINTLRTLPYFDMLHSSLILLTASTSLKV
ncbi:hypothetical protein L7F22_054839 [Adiantum nelumboides]|nr:hypothetical protein [Adiantum nelumboides]